MRFRPLFWPTLFTIPSVIVMLGLGVWQVERLHWKNGLLAALEAPPVPLPQTIDEARQLEFRRVVARGEFRHDAELQRYVAGDTGKAGVEVITPLRLPDGRLLLVNRGFVPEELKDPSKRPEGQVQGTVEVEGRLRLPRGKPAFYLPANQPERDFWLYVDPPAMAAARHLGEVLPFYIDAGPAPNPGGWPRGSSALAIRNDHLQYAITWFSLAAALAVIYVLYHRRRSAQHGAAG